VSATLSGNQKAIRTGGLFCFCANFQILQKQTSSPRGISAEKPVNNSSFKPGEPPDSIGGFELFESCSRAVFGEQAVHIKSLSVWEFQL